MLGLPSWYTLVISVAVVVELFLIIWLLIKNHRRNDAQRNEQLLVKPVGSANFGEGTQQLPTSDERFIKAFRANPQPMSLTTIDQGVYLDVNQSFLNMSGYVREEVIGHSSLELHVWETPQHRAAFIEKLEETGSVVNLETKFRTKDGSLRVLLSSAEKLDIGNRSCLLVASSDVTERVKTQQALRESEERFRNMADSAPVMIWVSGPDKTCTYFNQRWLEFTGRSFEQESGFGWAEGVHPNDYPHCLEIYSNNFDMRTPFEMEYRLRRADGEYRWVLDSGIPRFSEASEFLGYIGSCIDITERRESEEQLKKAHAELGTLKNQLEAENIYLQAELQMDHTFGEMVGQSDSIKYVTFKINQIAPMDSTVLIMGETGTGKELVARAIHDSSKRSHRPLIKVNCAALSPTLIESELFGHEKGAFTGAGARSIGRFELAAGGTIFLDEIGELPLELQSKLLRVIQEGEIERVGSTKTLKVDVRIIAATNRNLKDEVDRATFRQDLWYRLNVFPITVPPLRKRPEDIPLLVDHFVARAARKFGKTIDSVPTRTMQALQSHHWPGNVRELLNVIERAVIHTQGNVLRLAEHFEPVPEEQPSEFKSLEDVEREYILRVLESTGWRIEGRSGAAKILELNPSTLRTRMAKLHLQKRKASGVLE
jgi:PAS domain S-box-containing protein